MNTIKNINEQVKKIIEEVQRTYTSGMEFDLKDLNSYRACIGAASFGSLHTQLHSSIQKVASYVGNKYKMR